MTIRQLKEENGPDNSKQIREQRTFIVKGDQRVNGGHTRRDPNNKMGTTRPGIETKDLGDST
jgi:hypothetical protein